MGAAPRTARTPIGGQLAPCPFPVGIPKRAQDPLAPGAGTYSGCSPPALPHPHPPFVQLRAKGCRHRRVCARRRGALQRVQALACRCCLATGSASVPPLPSQAAAPVPSVPGLRCVGTLVPRPPPPPLSPGSANGRVCASRGSICAAWNATRLKRAERGMPKTKQKRRGAHRTPPAPRAQLCPREPPQGVRAPWSRPFSRVAHTTLMLVAGCNPPRSGTV